MKILVVDDHPIMREGIYSLLKSDNPNREIFVAENEIKAQENLKENSDLGMIILDINLTNKNGLDFIPNFRAINKEIKILVYTTYVEPIRIYQALKCGIDGYVTKSASPEELVKAVKLIESGANYFNNETNRLLKNLLSDGKYGNESPVENLFNSFKQLSEKEKRLFSLLSTNMTISEIAKKEKVSEKTISNLSSILYSKMNANGRLEITQMAKTLGVIL